MPPQKPEPMSRPIRPSDRLIRAEQLGEQKFVWRLRLPLFVGLTRSDVSQVLRLSQHVYSPARRDRLTVRGQARSWISGRKFHRTAAFPVPWTRSLSVSGQP